MKKRLTKQKSIRWLILAATLLFLSACGSSLANQDIMERLETEANPVIRWGVKADTNLFGFYNISEGEIQGFDIDIAQALSDEITNGQASVELVEVTSKTRIPLLKNGNIDGIIATMTITEERLEQVDFTEVYFDAGQSLLVPVDSNITGIDSLTSNHTILAIKGSTSAQNIRELAPQVNVLEMENYSEGFVALQSGQGDALTTDNAILLGLAAQAEGYTLAGENFTDEPYGIAVNKGQNKFLTELNEALQTIKANGTYDEIYDKWFGEILGGGDA